MARNRVRNTIRKNPERDFQVALVRDLRTILPSECFLTAFPAGGGGPVRGAQLKRMGLVAGFPDLLFIYRGAAYGMELKVKRRPSAAQKDTHLALGIAGMDVRVARTHDDALAILSEWGIPTRIVGNWIQRKKAA